MANNYLQCADSVKLDLHEIQQTVHAAMYLAQGELELRLRELREADALRPIGTEHDRYLRAMALKHASKHLAQAASMLAQACETNLYVQESMVRHEVTLIGVPPMPPEED